MHTFWGKEILGDVYQSKRKVIKNKKIIRSWQPRKKVNSTQKFMKNNYEMKAAQQAQKINSSNSNRKSEGPQVGNIPVGNILTNKLDDH